MWRRRRPTDDEFRQEVEAHVALETDRLLGEGLNPEDAAATARRSFGNMTRSRERYFESLRFMWLDDLGRDVRLASRALMREPRTAAAVVLTLGLGIGASTAVYGVFNFVLFRPVPGVGDERGLVNISVLAEPRWMRGVNSAHFRTFESSQSFSGVASHVAPTYPVASGDNGDPEPLDVDQVTSGYFEILQVRPHLGRFFGPEDYQLGRSTVVVVSEHFWRTRLHADPTAVGSTLRVAGHPFTIVGVTKTFRGIDRVPRQDLWVPRSATVTLDGGVFRDTHQFMIGRLLPGVSLEQAQQETRAAFDSVGPLETRDPTDPAGIRRLRYRPFVFSGLDDGASDTKSRLLSLFWIASAGVSMLFLLACANTANLLVARNRRRHRETALKLALGASRLRVWRELMLETTVLATIAVVAGLLISHGIMQLFRGNRLIDYLPPLEDLTLDRRVMAFAAVAGAATVFLAAAFPSMIASGSHPHGALRDFARGSRSSRRLRHGLLMLQVTLSIVLGASAGVLARTLYALTNLDLGFQPAGLYSVSLSPMSLGYDDPRIISLFRSLERRLASTPGIDGAAFASSGPLGGMSIGRIDSSAETPLQASVEILLHEVSADYFLTLGIPIRAGRLMTQAEVEGASDPLVTVIDESFARRVFGSKVPIGAKLAFWEPDGRDLNKTVLREVIGVVGNTRSRELRTAPQPNAYLPASKMRVATFQVRSKAASGETAILIRNAIRALEPQLAGTAIRTTQDDVAELSAQETVLSKISAILGSLALLLAVTGAVAVVAGGIAERVKEFGIRVALGATQGDITVETLRPVLGVSCAGTMAGLAIYMFAARWLTSRVFEVRAFDPTTIVVLVSLLFISVLAATWTPVRHAARTDPVVALRTE